MKAACKIFVLVALSSILQAQGIVKSYSHTSIKVPINKYPWIIQTINQRGRQSSGFLINKRYVLTAAHVVDNIEKRRCLSIHFLNYQNPFFIQINRIALSPLYNHNKNIFNDIAVLELSTPVEEKLILSSTPAIDFQPYTCKELYSFQSLIGSGYAMRTSLREANLTWETNQECAEPNGPYKYYLSYDGYSERGDSGSPLFYWENNSYHVLGVAIQSLFCNNCGNIYETMMHNVDFIQNATSHFQNSEDAAQFQPQIEWISLECPPASTASSTSKASTTMLFLVVFLTHSTWHLR
ncbi:MULTISPECIES: trypsin-like serine protease [unclassified Endozoicomonas]|uniref:trypsin-like serine protease n=1 Tax=unclassified Endozoicomonas TaxID=2644528 RepID=UPI003BB77648